MTLGIRAKLIIALASTSLLITAIAFVAMLLSFRSGFLQYINDYRYQSLEALLEVIEDEVRTPSQWRQLIRRKRYWDELVSSMFQETQQYAIFSRPPPVSQESRKKNDGHPKKSKDGFKKKSHSLSDEYRFADKPHPKKDHRPPPSRNNRRSPPQPFVLLDVSQRLIYGRELPLDEMWILPVTIDDQVQGYIGMGKLTAFESSADQVFVANQTKYFIGIAIIASIIALAIAFILARWMGKPIQHLDKAMSALMKRDYTVKLQHDANDEIGRLVQSFNQLSNSLDEYEQSQQRWIADISHELRTPLATLRGEMEAIKEGVREFNAERLHSLYEEALRLQRIVDDLHQLSLSDAGSMRYVYDEVSVIGVIKHVVACNEVALDSHGLNCSIIVKGDEKKMYADADRLSQLFYNLLQNSIRYTDNGGQLQITISFTDDKNLMICWEDSEPGVATDSLDKLFNRLYREEKSRNREKGGSGLGLSICRAIVGAHQGDIYAKQSSLGGVAIEIKFPI